MNPILIFVAILLVIWTLSAVASWANKQNEAQRRQRVREQMARAGLTPTPPRQPPPLRINPAIAKRFPDVLLPPRPQAPPARRMPPRLAAPPPLKRAPFKQPPRVAKPQRRKGQAIPAAPPPQRQPARPAHTTMASLPAAPPVVSRSVPAPVSAKANASALARWLRPATLQGQFIMTEIFQPPIALRPERNIL